MSIACKFSYMENQTFGDRLRALRKSRKFTQKDIARALNISAPAVVGWENNKALPSAENLLNLCKLLNTTTDYLTYGATGVAQIRENPGHYSARRARNPVPVVEWQTVLAAKKPIVSSLEAAAVDEAECPVACSSITFALKVFGDSMSSPSGLSIPADYIIMVDPMEAKNIRHGDLIIAVDKSGKSLTFKQFQTNGIERWLKALNPGYPELHGPFEVVGKVVYAGMDL